MTVQQFFLSSTLRIEKNTVALPPKETVTNHQGVDPEDTDRILTDTNKEEDEITYRP